MMTVRPKCTAKTNVMTATDNTDGTDVDGDVRMGQ